jgi:hypothetical protein
VLLIVAAVGVSLWLWLAPRSRASDTATPGANTAQSSPLVGRWEKPPQGDGTTSILTIRADGTMSSTVFDARGDIQSDYRAEWTYDGTEIAWRSYETSLFARIRDRLPGSGTQWERAPVVSVNEREFILGRGPHDPLVMKAYRGPLTTD